MGRTEPFFCPPGTRDDVQIMAPLEGAPLTRALDVHRNDVYAVIFLMTHRRCVVTQQAERYFPVVRYVRRLSEVREPVLQVLPFRSRHKLQLRTATARQGGYNQAAGHVLFQNAAFIRQ